ncbi:hypothetical protein Pse7367_3810 (plasmid) [Thalassoporum mexicanum PCC 7367]|uniref:class I SAM-dependent methyltransferase n=1 Tax=Thalassoporum mexicanum TaxID=3457544 RepID=UPI00029F9F86|nr:hypothetical protein [Pseudanabaena sp. PCC 7367]AFY72033.1 hypothetical protein Pse7367_3810 [Pseudanabaena sp. PCC 7367]
MGFASIKGFGRRIKNRIQGERLRLAQKCVIGAGNIPVPGWLITDKSLVDITNQNDMARYWPANSRQAFLAEHVWEHLPPEEADQANANCFKFLRSGGWLRLAVPDGLHPDPAYIELVRPGGTGDGSDDHKVLYDWRSLSASLEKAGFKINLLEYWDENGEFHYQDWSSEQGHIRRSKRYDPRNQDGSLTYTSLIIDAIKP